MYDYTGWIVRADAGRDKNGIFCVVGVDQEGPEAAAGRREAPQGVPPQGQKLGHVWCLTDQLHMYDHPVVHSLREGEPVSDRALRRALAAFKEGSTLG